VQRLKVIKFDKDLENHQIAAVMLHSAWKYRDPSGYPLVKTHTSPERSENIAEIKEMFDAIIFVKRDSEKNRTSSSLIVSYEGKKRETLVELLTEFWEAWRSFADPDLVREVQITNAFLKELPIVEE
jgi:hypothetical protein